MHKFHIYLHKKNETKLECNWSSEECAQDEVECDKKLQAWHEQRKKIKEERKLIGMTPLVLF